MAQYRIVKMPSGEYAVQRVRFFGLCLSYWSDTYDRFNPIKRSYSTYHNLETAKRRLRFCRGEFEIIEDDVVPNQPQGWMIAD
jgi:hypothetical protein